MLWSSAAPFAIVLAAIAVPMHAVAAPASAPAGPRADAVVAADGSGDFRTVQEALVASPQSVDAAHPWTILIKPGIYREIVYAQREKRFVTLRGEDPLTTTITYDLDAGRLGPDGRPIGTFRTATVNVDADDFAIENLTLVNAAGPTGQALALRVDGDRCVFRRCRFIGWQDTILTNRGRQYFEDCTIAGATDFLFGGATSFFARCDIHVLGGGFVTAASTPDGQPFGYVFSDCRIVGDRPGLHTYLGRPWRGFASTVWLNTEMGDVVNAAGWHNWNSTEKEKTVRYAEYCSTGPGGDAAGRVPWAKQLSAEEAAGYAMEKVLAGSDGWKPAVIASPAAPIPMPTTLPFATSTGDRKRNAASQATSNPSTQAVH